MTDFLSQFESINSIKDLIIPALAAAAGFWAAGQKFKNERLWQEKYAAYQRVLSSIEAIRYWGDEMSSDVHMLPSIGWFDGKAPHEFYAEAKREVAKQCNVGAILLAPTFVSVLEKFQSDLFDQAYAANDEHHDDEREAEAAFGAHAIKVRGIADTYLPQLIEIARKDLGARASLTARFSIRDNA